MNRKPLYTHHLLLVGSMATCILRQARWLVFFPSLLTFANSHEWQATKLLLTLSSHLDFLPASKQHGSQFFQCTHQLSDNYFRSCYVRTPRSTPHQAQIGNKPSRFGTTSQIKLTVYFTRFVSLVSIDSLCSLFPSSLSNSHFTIQAGRPTSISKKLFRSRKISAMNYKLHY